MYKSISKKDNQIVKTVEIEVCETIYQWVEIDCPLCNSRGYLDGYFDDVEYVEHYIYGADCPCCDGRGTIDHEISYDIDETYTVETAVTVSTYEEGCISDDRCYYGEYDRQRAIDRYKQLNGLTSRAGEASASE